MGACYNFLASERLRTRLTLLGFNRDSVGVYLAFVSLLNNIQMARINLSRRFLGRFVEFWYENILNVFLG